MKIFFLFSFNDLKDFWGSVGSLRGWLEWQGDEEILRCLLVSEASATGNMAWHTAQAWVSAEAGEKKSLKKSNWKQNLIKNISIELDLNSFLIYINIYYSFFLLNSFLFNSLFKVFSFASVYLPGRGGDREQYHRHHRGGRAGRLRLHDHLHGCASLQKS